jgi:malate permease and related proteins
MLSDLFSIIAPVFICGGVGFAWTKLGNPYDVDLVTSLVTNVGVPCLVFYSLTNTDLNPKVFGSMAFTSLAAIATCGLMSGLVLSAFRLDKRTFLSPLMFSNCGNMGLPLCMLAFGEPGLVLAIVFFTISAIAQFTIGIMITSGTLSLAGLVKIPILYAVALAVLFMFLNIEPLDFITNTTRILGGMSIPLMLITLGVSLVQLRVAALPRSTVLSVLRLVLGFGVGVGLTKLLGIKGLEQGVLIVQSAMPVAVFNYLFAQRYKRAPEEVAGMVAISTAISFITLPALLWYVL